MIHCLWTEGRGFEGGLALVSVLVLMLEIEIKIYHDQITFSVKENYREQTYTFAKQLNGVCEESSFLKLIRNNT